MVRRVTLQEVIGSRTFIFCRANGLTAAGLLLLAGSLYGWAVTIVGTLEYTEFSVSRDWGLRGVTAFANYPLRLVIDMLIYPLTAFHIILFFPGLRLADRLGPRFFKAIDYLWYSFGLFAVYVAIVSAQNGVARLEQSNLETRRKVIVAEINEDRLQFVNACTRIADLRAGLLSDFLSHSSVDEAINLCRTFGTRVTDHNLLPELAFEMTAQCSKIFSFVEVNPSIGDDFYIELNLPLGNTSSLQRQLIAELMGYDFPQIVRICRRSRNLSQIDAQRELIVEEILIELPLRRNGLFWLAVVASFAAIKLSKTTYELGFFGLRR